MQSDTYLITIMCKYPSNIDNIMAKFFGGMQGNGELTTRSGTRKSGMWTHLRTHTLGLLLEVNVIGKETVFTVHETGGSNNSGREKLLVTIKEPNKRSK